MTEQAGIEDEDYDISVNFEGHPPEEVVIKQVGYGFRPSFTLDTIIDEETNDVTFNIETYGVGEIREFLETVKSLIDTILERDLDWKDEVEAEEPETDD